MFLQVLVTESESNQSFRNTLQTPPAGGFRKTSKALAAQDAFDRLREYAIRNLCTAVKAQLAAGDPNTIRALVAAITTRLFQRHDDQKDKNWHLSR